MLLCSQHTRDQMELLRGFGEFCSLRLANGTPENVVVSFLLYYFFETIFVYFLENRPTSSRNNIRTESPTTTMLSLTVYLLLLLAVSTTAKTSFPTPGFSFRRLSTSQPTQDSTDLIMFTGPNCLHCDAMEKHLNKISKTLGLKIAKLDIWETPMNLKVSERVSELCGAGFNELTRSARRSSLSDVMRGEDAAGCLSFSTGRLGSVFVGRRLLGI